MSNIRITTVSGSNNIFGDNNIINSHPNSIGEDKVLTRNDYFNIILEIRELERISLGDYLADKLQKHSGKNPDFVKILYKDIAKILEGVDIDGDNDLLLESGDFVIEYGDFKLTGNPTNLHYALVWLHLQVIEEFSKDGTLDLAHKLERFEKDYLKINYDTPDYTKKLTELNSQLKIERRSKTKTGWSWRDLLDMVELKPNFYGIGVNLNAVLSKVFGHKNAK